MTLLEIKDLHVSYSTASGLLQTTQQIGGALGLAVIVSVYASNSVPGEFTPGLSEAMDTGSILALIALIVAGVATASGRRAASSPELVSAAAE